ncbi:MAG TPA: hypothetical protein VKQ52_00665, partial [Puia sp.]|nr:hypothetical protein [Puia sp.]
MQLIKIARFFLLFLSCILVAAVCISQGLPIKPTRTISFSTDEGSYMDVDISPDGKTLLFDLLGDLYTVPSTGGKAQQMTRGVALNLKPIWSPNGKNIAYISDTSGSFHLNVIDIRRTFHRVLGKTEYPLEFQPDAVWTPDGNYLVYGEAIYGLAGGLLSTVA